ncbi:MAG: sigma-54-dependent Fis family transcriptional regulator [Legionellales bacterium]|nr:sigma-54-dependent Fis family transcriptional regulator [Legionellales bacterium]|tara:strand:- start:12726 stop:14069 length:1344 start_codon:yes stop_codon:yes gene_type:complete
MTNQKALIVDDEPDIRELIIMTLERMGIECHGAADLAQANKLLAEKSFDLCLTDMRLPDGDGIDLVRTMQQLYPCIPVAVITAFGNMDLAVTALKAGAFDFVSKPVNLGILRDLVNTAMRLAEVPQTPTVPRLLGESTAIKSLRLMIAKLARSQAPVLITGASGTGKELVARLIHEQGPRAEKPFVPVNCGAIPRELMESEFFGHKKGSFTGAIADKEGLFQTANGGTLFLDEVAELPLYLQVKLLRAIQEKAVLPIGNQKEINVDVRILSATNKDLGAMIQAGEFRQDLYYRINVIELTLPPLNTRTEDIPILCDAILDRLVKSLGIKKPKIDKPALALLMNYGFPGNVRELENILERAVTLSDKAVIHVDDIQLQTSATMSESETTSPAAPEDNLGKVLGDIEREKIIQALEDNRWNKTAAAKQLGLTLRALRYRLQKLGLDKKK